MPRFSCVDASSSWSARKRRRSPTLAQDADARKRNVMVSVTPTRKIVDDFEPDDEEGTPFIALTKSDQLDVVSLASEDHCNKVSCIPCIPVEKDLNGEHTLRVAVGNNDQPQEFFDSVSSIIDSIVRERSLCQDYSPKVKSRDHNGKSMFLSPKRVSISPTLTPKLRPHLANVGDIFYDNASASTFSIEINSIRQHLLSKYATLLEKNLDKFEIYALRNVFKTKLSGDHQATAEGSENGIIEMINSLDNEIAVLQFFLEHTLSKYRTK